MNNFIIINADTDSISFGKQDGAPFSEEEQEELLASLNSLYPEKIKWEHDGIFDVFVVLKAKNYLKLHDGHIETKGSSIRNPNKEPALREFIGKVVECLLYDKANEVINIYYQYVREIHNVQDISRWCTKKTITESVLNPQRTNEQNILDALGGRQVQMGDKWYFYFLPDEEVKVIKDGKTVSKKLTKLKLQEDWNNDHCPEKLLNKLYKTINIFKNVYDVDQIPKFHLKSHEIRCTLADVLGLPHPEKVTKSRKKKDEVLN